jgi:hypothetical protein
MDRKGQSGSVANLASQAELAHAVEFAATEWLPGLGVGHSLFHCIRFFSAHIYLQQTIHHYDCDSVLWRGLEADHGQEGHVQEDDHRGPLQEVYRCPGQGMLKSEYNEREEAASERRICLGSRVVVTATIRSRVDVEACVILSYGLVAHPRSSRVSEFFFMFG